jgi:hypothetical protein
VSAALIMAWWGIALPLGFAVVRKVGIEHVGAEGHGSGNVQEGNEAGRKTGDVEKA